MSIPRQEMMSYYEECEADYRLFWDLDHSLAMHAGFWDETTHSLRQALERENEILTYLAHITPSDRVLDAGCGVGGSAIYLANHVGCHVTGITLSEKQKEAAERHAVQRVREGHPSPEFLVMDFTQARFPDHSFDVVWSIESVCHAENKAAFVKEAFRLLKPNGRLIIADAFLSEMGGSHQEHQWMKTWLRGWGVQALEKEGDFRHHLEHTGFRAIEFIDMTPRVLPSSKRLFWLSYPGFALAKFNEWAFKGSRFRSANLLSARYQYKTLRQSLWKYGVFLAKKKE